MDEAIYPIIGKNSANLIIAAGIGWCDDQYHCIRREGYPLPQINLCTGGRGVLITEGKTAVITEGTSFFLPPDIPHEYYSDGGEWSLRWVTFSGTGCSALLEQFGLTHAVVTAHKDTADMERAWQSAYNVLKRSGENDSFRADSYMFRFLTEYHISRMKSEETPSESSAFRLAEEYIAAHFTEDITIGDISAAAGVSPQYLCRIFRRRIDMRPFQYVARRRIQYAKQLLSRGGLSVAAVSQMAGYNDVSYFCQCFRREEGVSPAKFMSSGG